MDTNRGLSVTTTSLEVIESINHYHQQILGAGKTPHFILDAVKKILIMCCFRFMPLPFVCMDKLIRL